MDARVRLRNVAFLLLLVAAGCGGDSSGPSHVELVRAVNFPCDDCAVRAVAVVPGSGAIAVGTFTGRIDLDPGDAEDARTSVSVTEPDLFMVRIGPAGEKRWAFTIGGERREDVNDVALTSDGGAVIVGSFGGAVDFDPGSGQTMFDRPGRGTDAYVVRYDAQGRLVWARRFTGYDVENYWARAERVHVMADGFTVVSGLFGGDIDFEPPVRRTHTSAGPSDGFVTMLDGLGRYLWSNQIGGLGEENALLDGYADAIWVVGTYTGEIDLDLGPEQKIWRAPEEVSSYILRFRFTGVSPWSSALDAQSSLITDLDVTAASELLTFGGTTRGRTDFDPWEPQRIVEAAERVPFVAQLTSSHFVGVTLFDAPGWSVSVVRQWMGRVVTALVPEPGKGQGTRLHIDGPGADRQRIDLPDVTVTSSSTAAPLLLGGRQVSEGKTSGWVGFYGLRYDEE